jgi:ATP-dependent Zn protease
MQGQPNEATQEGPQTRAAAVHEAGHAVVAGHWGYDVYQNHVGSDGRGEVRFTHPEAEYDTPEGRLRLLTVDVAGSIAEDIAFPGVAAATPEDFQLEGVRLARESLGAGMSEREVLAEHDRGDAAEAAMLLRGLSDDEAERQVRLACEDARRILTESWADVEAMVEHGAGGR